MSSQAPVPMPPSLLLALIALIAGAGACRRDRPAQTAGQPASTDPVARREALRTLGKRASAGQIASSAAVPTLIEGLADADAGVRAVAAASLGTLRACDDMQLPPLAHALDDPSPLVRMNAARALGLCGERAAPVASKLLRALDDTDPDTRRAAVTALAYHPETRYVPPADVTGLPPGDAAARVVRMGRSVEPQALFGAARDGDVAVVVLLLRAGLDPNTRDEVQRTPLMLAGSHPDVLRVLLAGGADVNARAPSGTALFSAVIATNPASVKVLLEAGADTRLQKNTGETALDYAASGSGSRAEEIRRLLRSKGRAP